MTRNAYRAMTFVGLALTVVNITQRLEIAAFFNDLLYDHASFPMPVTEAILNNWGITIFAVLTLGLAYLWVRR